jgi:hypothetical protein
LIGPEEYSRSLEALTAPPPQDAEDFGVSATSDSFSAQPFRDFSWIQHIHLPARAHWMLQEWDGSEVPGPHQCEPKSLNELVNWWAGALRYVSKELPH